MSEYQLCDYSAPSAVMLTMLMDNTHKNVHIYTADNKLVSAHSSVLAAVSSVLRIKFEDNKFGIFQIRSTTIKASTWLSILEFVYTGNIFGQKRCDIQELFAACKMLEIDKLKMWLNYKLGTSPNFAIVLDENNGKLSNSMQISCSDKEGFQNNMMTSFDSSVVEPNFEQP